MAIYGIPETRLLIGGALSGALAAGPRVAVTAGFGAVLISRAGTRRTVPPQAPVAPLDDMSWQTPTPVSGVAAARRPTPVASGKGR